MSWHRVPCEPDPLASSPRPPTLSLALCQPSQSPSESGSKPDPIHWPYKCKGAAQFASCSSTNYTLAWIIRSVENKFTEFEKSSKKFAVTKDKKCGDVVELGRLQTLAAFPRVLVEVKVVQVDDAVEVSGGKKYAVKLHS